MLGGCRPGWISFRVRSVVFESDCLDGLRHGKMVGPGV